MPQFEVIADPRFLTAMAGALRQERHKPGVSADDKTLLSTLVTRCLSMTISKVDFFAPKTKGGPMSPDPALQLIELCIRTQNVELVQSITDRLTDATGSSGDGIKCRVRRLLLPLMPLVDAELKASKLDSTGVPGIKKLYETAIERGLSFMLSDASVSPKSDLALLVEACAICDNALEILGKR